MVADDKVILFGQHANQNTALSSAARQAIKACRETLSMGLPKSFAFFDGLDDALFDLADKAESNQKQEEYFTAMRQIRLVQADTHYHKVSIKSNGPGLSQKQQEQLFDPDTIYDTEKESELGLTYCKRSMTIFNGTINYYSSDTRFTEFSLSFPGAIPTADENNEFKFIPQARLFSGSILVNKTILVIADESNNISNLLEGLGVNILKASDRKQALGLIEQTACNLIITGLDMPVVDRLEFVRTARLANNQQETILSKNQVIPIIAVLDEQNSALAKACYQAGINALSIVPIEKDRLINTIVQQLSFFNLTSH